MDDKLINSIYEQFFVQFIVHQFILRGAPIILNKSAFYLFLLWLVLVFFGVFLCLGVGGFLYCIY